MPRRSLNKPGLLYPRRYTTLDLQRACIHPLPRVMKFVRAMENSVVERFSGVGCGACGKVLEVKGRVRRGKMPKNFSITYLED